MMRRILFPVCLSAVLLLAGCYAVAGRVLDLPPYTDRSGVHLAERIAMRDGVRLVTDVYLPEGDGPWPVIIIRNPYNFTGGGFKRLAKLFSRYGYVGVHQLTRGRADSEGEWLPFFNERNDGLDTLEWVIAQDWQDGNIGFFGASYLSMVQWAMADVLPPEVKTLVPMVWGSDVQGLAYQGGMFRHEITTTWAALMHSEQLTYGNMFNYWRALAHRPHAEVDELYFGKPLPWYREWVMSPHGDAPLWSIPDALLLREIPELTQVPVLMVGGWYDIFINSQLDDFRRLASRADSRMLVGPWTHLTGFSGDGIRPLPNAGGGPELLHKVLNWFDHHLKGEPLDPWGPIDTYTIGDGRWRSWAQWPPPTGTGTLFFHEAQDSARCNGGRLLLDPPVDHQQVSYVYDPEKPVPSRGGAGLLSFAIPGWRGTPPSMRDQVGLCNRKDVLSFVSPPLAGDVHLAGRLKVTMTVSSDVDDTAFTAKIIEVDPYGVAVNIRDTITSLAYRNGVTMPVDYQPGELVELVLETWPIEWKIPRGHRVRVDISSSNFPAYHAHTNYAGPWALQVETRPAVQTLHVGPGAPARLDLPIIPPSRKTSLAER